MGQFRFAREEFTGALFAEMLPLLERHWAEVAHFADIPLEVDESVYRTAEARGALRIYTVRTPSHQFVWEGREIVDVLMCSVREPYTATILLAGESEPLTVCSSEIDAVGSQLVGYAVYFVRHNPHYASSLQAVEDVIYVAPAARGSTGAKLIRFADDQLRAEGVVAVFHHVKVAHNWGKLLERMGYEAVDVIYAKRLDKEDAK